ncbi:hypothetical protein [Fodinicurvata sp. EGI_FJ10296]|uniref:hypothetical protein n=1 Tax=Fodinicurvata sp. EGI_FJ10296 TaxID=3231908 RepID=UPI0034530F17
MTQSRTSRRIDPTAEKVSFLGSPTAYPTPTRRVETLETTMSWVFLTDDRAFKLKKPVQHRHLDFSTLEKRRFFCEEEVRLNRRLAAETYVRTLPLRRLCSGGLTLGEESVEGTGRVVDWLVEMKRLPQSDMLDARIRQGRLQVSDVRCIATRLSDFYIRARRPENRVDGTSYLRFLAAEQGLNRSILMRRALGLANIAAGPLAAVDRLFDACQKEIGDRMATHMIVEGHGDLRPEHICLTDPPQIIDCLEFNRAMRIIDPCDEITYLGMECDMLGASGVRGTLERMMAAAEPSASDRSGAGPFSDPSPALLALYGGFRALLRARLCIVHLLSKPVRHAERWRPLAIAYIRQAEREIDVATSSRAPVAQDFDAGKGDD